MTRRTHMPALALGLALLASCGTPDRELEGNAAPAAAEAEESPVPAPVENSPQPPSITDRDASDTALGANVSPCLVQDGERIPANLLRGIGTEPFWGVRIEGRCVTYSTPEDQDGTRVWTQFSGTAEDGTWSGFLDKQRFILRTRPEPGCSDGMSDNRYPIAVSLTVRGEERTGCAEPL